MKTLHLYVVCAICVVSVSCDRAAQISLVPTDNVEIASNRWLAITQRASSAYTDADKEWSEIRFKWENRDVRWRGAEIPVSLREHEGSLYMIGFNREKLHQQKCRLVYYSLNDKGTSFREISASEYPPAIATQNMWMSNEPRHQYVYVSENEGSVLVDNREMLRTLDIESPGFAVSLTSAMWCQIETGAEYYEQTYRRGECLEEYVRKYKPIALPTVLMEVAGQGQHTQTRPNKSE